MKFQQYLEFGFVQFIRGLLFFLPRRAVLWLGKRIGDLVYLLDVRHRMLVFQNLNRAYRNEITDKQKVAIARGTYQHFASMFLDILRPHKPTKAKMESFTEVEGWENLEAAAAKGKGVLILTAHLGHWEQMGVAQGFAGKPIHVLARKLNNPKLDDILRRYRSCSGNTVHYKANAVRAIMEVLRDKGTAAVLIDQNVNPGRGIFVKFFGVAACTTTVVSALAIKTGAPIVPAFALPLPGDRWKHIYDKPLEFSPDDRSAEKIAEITQVCTSIIEYHIRQHPEAWLWMHRRWKTRPGDEEQS